MDKLPYDKTIYKQRYKAKNMFAKLKDWRHGTIIALESDRRIEQALKVAPNTIFYRYQLSSELHKVGAET